MNEMHSQPARDDLSGDLELEDDCIITAIRHGKDDVTVTVTLTGTVTIPGFAARELLKEHHTYTVADMLLDLFLPRWGTALKLNASRRVREAVTGVKSFDPDMTNTLR